MKVKINLNECTVIDWDYGNAKACNNGTAIVGNYGIAKAGYYGTAIAGNEGTAIVRDNGTAIVGYKGTAKACDNGTAIVGYKGTAKAGNGGLLAILHYNGKEFITKYAIVGENGIKPNVAYTLDQNGNFVETEQKKSKL